MTTEPEMQVYAPALDGMSEEEFYQFCQANTTANFERDSEGNILIMAPTNYDSGGQEFDLMVEFGIWNKQHKLGKAFSSNAGFTLPNGAVRSPDLAWVSNERATALPQSERQKFAHICPDFVVEIRSKTDSLPALKAKMQEYIDNGCQLGFLIDPYQQKAYVYAPNKEAVTVDSFQQKLSGGTLLPGFELDLSLFLL